MIVIIDVLNKNIRVEDKNLSMSTQDFSWIPSNVTYVRWYGSEGQIQYAANENGNVSVELITELGIYEKAIEMFNNEKQLLEDAQNVEQEALEATKDYWKELRRLRDQKLAECDWTQIADVPLTEEQKPAWVTYRQALRDLPANTEDPKNPIWPAKPSF
jgi:hypothetical protein